MKCFTLAILLVFIISSCMNADKESTRSGADRETTTSNVESPKGDYGLSLSVDANEYINASDDDLEMLNAMLEEQQNDGSTAEEIKQTEDLIRFTILTQKVAYSIVRSQN
jgi:hypothetical protein